MDETNPTSITTSSGSTTSNSSRQVNTSSSIIGGGGGGASSNMETKGVNIPTSADHAENKSPSSSIKESGEATTNSAVSGQSNATTKTSDDVLVPTNSTSSEPVNISEQQQQHLSHGKNGQCDKESKAGSIGEPDIGCKDDPSNISRSNIDPLQESTTNLSLASGDQGKSSVVATTTTTSNNNLPASSTSVTPTPEKVVCPETDNTNPDNSFSASNSQLTAEEVASSLHEADNSQDAFLTTSNKPPVPNFRVEGSGTGDSSITVAVASLSSAISASVSLHSGGGRAGSTGGSNSLENGEQPGSSSGPVSIQSSEEMRLSLVSWYSEPDDPSRLIEGCCSALNTYRNNNDEGILIEEIVGDRDTCGSSASMGHDAISSVNTNVSSPAFKSESDEKENKTPEPCGNSDKMNCGGDDNGSETTGTLSTKPEFVNPNSNDKVKTIDANNSSNNHNASRVTIEGNSALNSNQLLRKGGSCETNGTPSGKSNSAISSRDKGSDSSKCVKHGGSSSHKSKSHVHMSDHKHSSSCTPQTPASAGHLSRCHQDGSGRSMKPECPRCSRRSKSGTTTPATGAQISRTRTPASRRVVQSSKSSTEIKKPIKSILKHDSRGSAGSGSDKQSSMDSLGSSGDIGVTPAHVLRGRMSSGLMTRSDSGTRARFNFSSNSAHAPATPTGAPEDRVVSKLKRIEKYATLRMRKPLKARPLDLNDSDLQSNDVHNSGCGGVNNSQRKTGVPGVPNELMSKSMSYLEKASSSNRVHISSAQGHHYGESTSASSTLKRQGSLRMKKHGTPPQWEPSGTRTSALRLQKMQEAKAKNCPGGASSGSGNSGSAHSGSGDSLHYLPHSANSTTSASGGSSGMSSIHLSGAHSAPSTHTRVNASVAAAKEKHMGAKIFSKLSSALGQTASSNQKRLKQERGVQTEVAAAATTHHHDMNNGVRLSLSPIPALEYGTEAAEQIKNLERLCNRYRSQVMKVQSDYEDSESKKVELIKQLQETQHESNEMIEFLQAEKSTLAESLTEVEVEAKKWKEEIDAMKTDYQSRCSSLVRLSEQHKQEALKSQAILHRLESQSASVICQLSHQITDGAQSVQLTKQRVTTLTESLLKTYKVPAELLASSETNQTIKETDLSCSLLLPLITSLSAAFPMVPLEAYSSKSSTKGAMSAHITSNITSGHVLSPTTSSNSETHATIKAGEPTQSLFTGQSTSSTLTESSSFHSLNQAIMEREAAEKSCLDDILKPLGLTEGASPDADQLSLRKEITELNAAIAKLLNVVRVIVIHCDRKVSSVASSILQCLKSIEDDKVGNMAEIVQVQKSLEAWSDKSISSGGTSSSSSNGSPPYKTTVTPTTVGASPPSYLVGNGHAHV